MNILISYEGREEWHFYQLAKLSFGEAMRCRLRYFSDGMTVGSREFVEQVFEQARDRFGQKRKTGARPMRGVGWKRSQKQIYSMRHLVKNPLE